MNCLEDGKKFKSLIVHLAAIGLTPNQYRAKWNLPPDYRLFAPNYAAQRLTLGKQWASDKREPRPPEPNELAH